MSKTTKRRTVKMIERSCNNPFRSSGSYSSVFDVLAAHPKGISQDDLRLLVKKQLRLKGIRKPDTHINWDCRLVCSSRNDPNRLPHQSVRRASDKYFVIAENNFYRLHIK